MDQINDSELKSRKNDHTVIQMQPAEAIDVIMDIYGDEIKRLVFTYVKNKMDTDDVSQEVFVTVYQKLNTFQGFLTPKLDLCDCYKSI